MLSVKEIIDKGCIAVISLCCSYGTSTLTGCYKLDRHQELFKRRKNLNSYYARICFRMKMHFSFYLLTITFGSGLNILYSILEWITLQCGRCFTYDAYNTRTSGQERSFQKFSYLSCARTTFRFSVSTWRTETFCIIYEILVVRNMRIDVDGLQPTMRVLLAESDKSRESRLIFVTTCLETFTTGILGI